MDVNWWHKSNVIGANYNMCNYTVYIVCFNPTGKGNQNKAIIAQTRFNKGSTNKTTRKLRFNFNAFALGKRASHLSFNKH